jgi:hypothetical protein
MSKIHVLPDENLGGVLREFVEVDRRAKIGEKIVIKQPDRISWYEKGDIFTVVKSYENHPEFEDGVEVEEDFYFIYRSEYCTLEPTDIVHIDGARYRLVDRKAKVGEKVVVFGHSNENGNGVFTVYDVYVVNDAISYVGKDGRCYGASSKNYRVLEPVEPADMLTVDETEASKPVIDLLANLAHRLTTLEQQVARRVTELEREFERYADITRDKYDLINTRLSEIEKNIKTSEDIARDTILKALKEAMKW